METPYVARSFEDSSLTLHWRLFDHSNMVPKLEFRIRPFDWVIWMSLTNGLHTMENFQKILATWSTKQRCLVRDLCCKMDLFEVANLPWTFGFSLALQTLQFLLFLFMFYFSSFFLSASDPLVIPKRSTELIISNDSVPNDLSKIIWQLLNDAPVSDDPFGRSLKRPKRAAQMTVQG